ncbi:protein Wnt-2b-like [Porites lutea]|uniref:protein Wnt-2b-like n=1 Tax=Porites lutea TaxID=51062 RepID=UPI003CC5CE70
MGNSTCFFAVLLLSFPILSCSYWWFMSQVYDLDAQVMCNRAALVKDQKRFCEEYPDIAISIGKGAKLGVQECQKQLKDELWNCSTVARDVSVFGKVPRKASQETAFIYAITSSGVVHEITKACARGVLRNCACNNTQLAEGTGFEWGGCNDNIEYGLKYASKFIDSREKREHDIRAKINLHNNLVGRQAVKSYMRLVCKCHGISASCSYRTCLRTLGPFGTVGGHLYNKYLNATKVTVHQGRNQLIAADGKYPGKLLEDDLWFLEESPDYCVPNNNTGSLGTTGRRCHKTAPGPGNCRILCCGRGYNTLQVREEYECSCKFYWCCRVKCNTCRRMVDSYFCR